MRNLSKYLIIVILSLSLFEGSYALYSSEADVKSESKLNWVINNIKQKEKTLKTFTATFLQTKKSQLLREPFESEGLIYFDFSGKLLMKVIRPSPLTFLLKNNQQIVYYPDTSKVEKRTFSKGDDITRKYLGIGEPIEALKKRFEIELTNDQSSRGYHLKMIPKNKTTARHINVIEVMVDSEHWLPYRIHFKEKKGDSTTIQLQFTSINEPLPQDIFSIELPEKNNKER